MQRIREIEFDVLLLDMSMPGKSGIELIKQVHAEKSRLRILVLSMHEEHQYAVRAIRAGRLGLPHQGQRLGAARRRDAGLADRARHVLLQVRAAQLAKRSLFQPSMNDTSFRSAITHWSPASKQHAESLPSCVMWPSVNADQHGSGSRSAPMRPWLPAIGR